MSYIYVLWQNNICRSLTDNRLETDREGGSNGGEAPNVVVEELRMSCQLLDRQPRNISEDSRNLLSARNRNRKHTTGEKICISTLINDFLWRYFPVPVDKAYTKFEWLHDKNLSSINNTKTVYKDAIDLFDRTICLLSFDVLFDTIEKGLPLFGSSRENDDRYENREESNFKLHQFLEYQFGDQCEEFIEFLIEWLKKTSGKENCLNLIGPPSCGKTWFARLIKEACITSGQITNMSRNSSFPFNNCVNKRVLHWDEPS